MKRLCLLVFERQVCPWAIAKIIFAQFTKFAFAGEWDYASKGKILDSQRFWNSPKVNNLALE